MTLFKQRNDRDFLMLSFACGLGRRQETALFFTGKSAIIGLFPDSMHSK